MPGVGKWFAGVPMAACCRILPVAGSRPYSWPVCLIVQTKPPATIGGPPPTARGTARHAQNLRCRKTSTHWVEVLVRRVHWLSSLL